MLCSLAVLMIGAVSSDLPHRFYQDLGAPLHPAITLSGANPPGAVRNEGNGLRVVFTGQTGDASEVAVSPTFEVEGDFEITLDYEILSAAEPQKGFGAGVKIWGELDDQRGPQALTIARLLRPQRGHEVVAMVNDKSKPDGAGVQTTPQPFSDLKGRLRLERSGALVRFMAARAEDETFQEIFATEVSDAPLTSLRFIATRHGQKDPLDVRLKAIEIRATHLPAVALPSEGLSWAFWSAVALASIAAAGGFGFIVWRKRRHEKS